MITIELLKTEITDAIEVKQLSEGKFKVIYFSGFVDEFGKSEPSKLWSIEEDAEELGGKILECHEDENGCGECIIQF